jgi:uncharacterized protein YbjT (DUF2867 family)
MTKIAGFVWAGLLLSAAGADAAETVLVAGATGRTGAAIIKELKARGYAVRALARDVAEAKAELGDGYDWVQADVRSKTQVDVAFAGAEIDYVVSAIGSRTWIGPNSVQFVDYIGTKNLAEAARQAGVKRMVVISVGNAGPRADHTRDPSYGYIQYWKTKGEDAVKTSGVPYVIVGPGGLWDAPAGVKGIRVTARQDYKTARIAIGDAAAVAVEALTNPDARNKAFGIVNDDALKPGAWRADLKAMPEEPPGLPPTAIDPKSNTSFAAFDPAEAPIQRFAFTAYGTQIRGQEVAVPSSRGMFCTLSNAAGTYLNYFPAEQVWKIQMLHNDDPATPAGGLVTCHRLAAP